VIKRAIGYQKIRQFSDLVNSCRIYEEDTKAHYKVMNERRSMLEQGCFTSHLLSFDNNKVLKIINWTC